MIVLLQKQLKFSTLPTVARDVLILTKVSTAHGKLHQWVIIFSEISSHAEAIDSHFNGNPLMKLLLCYRCDLAAAVWVKNNAKVKWGIPASCVRRVSVLFVVRSVAL